MNILSRFFSFDNSAKTIKEASEMVKKINGLEADFEKLSDKDLKNKTSEFKKYIESMRKKQGITSGSLKIFDKLKTKEIQKKEQEILNSILPDCFAAVREAAKRTIGQRHYDVQLIGGMVLHQGKIAEMKTGEGKTLVATLPLYLNALLGRGAHLVTVNDFLAKSHTQWMGPIYDFLGLTVGCIQHEKSYLFDPKEKDIIFGEEHNLKSVSRTEAYSADITYGTNNEFGFDYLRDNMAMQKEDQAQRDLSFAIVDEIDSILIDEARTPLIISAPAQESTDLYQKFMQIANNLEKGKDYTVDEKDQAVSINDIGNKKVEKALGLENLYEQGGTSLVHHLTQALKAKELFTRDKDYIVKEGEIVIVDQFTGRLMPGRRYSEGLHQAIEAKESVEVKRESLTYATISFQNLFRLYTKLSGMTGTAKTEEEEFFKIYSLEVVTIPTNREMIRTDRADMIYKSEGGKFKAVVSDVKEKYKIGQPVLIGTIAIEKSEVISQMLKQEGIKHQILNAKNHEREAKTIANAGKLNSVTVATNMAGRGVDIILGGSQPKQSDNKEVIKEWKINHQKVVDLGGLYVIGTERHESRRIDNQLRGRSGRQGDPGVSQFYVSMDDDLMRVFGGDRIRNMMNILKIPEDVPIQNKMISNSIESAQKRVEGHNFDIRKNLVEFDDVMNKHRETIYEKRNKVLQLKNLKGEVILILKQFAESISLKYFDDKKELNKLLIAVFPKEYLEQDFEKKIENTVNEIALGKYISELVVSAYENKEKEIGTKHLQEIEKAVYLKTIDTLWVEHLTVMEELREGIGLVGYSQRDPLSEYKQRAYQRYNELQDAISNMLISTLFRVQMAPAMQAQSQNLQMKGADESMAAGTFESDEPSSVNVSTRVKNTDGEKVGRNDPCVCGSGKKYKKCCGK